MEKLLPIGIISGSGMRTLSTLDNPSEFEIDTPFGKPSAPLITGTIAGVPVVIMRRHGDGHTTLPSEINVRANIAALKMQGVRQVISFSAVGSLVESAPPGTFVLIDQYIDKTYLRKKTFFGDGVVAHVPFGDPVCVDTRAVIADAMTEAVIPHLNGGTYVVMEGPQFSSRAESEFHRSLSATVIGMTAMPEPKLCREAELCYSMLAMVTDYDCWHTDHDHVTADLVSARMADNAQKAEALLTVVLPRLAARQAHCQCGCRNALDGAIMTDPTQIGENKRRELSLFLDRVFGAEFKDLVETKQHTNDEEF